MGNGGFRKEKKKNTTMCIHTFSFFLAKRREPQPSSAKLSQPTIPIGIVAYAFTPMWGNLCQKELYTLTVPVSTQVYKWVSANLMQVNPTVD